MRWIRRRRRGRAAAFAGVLATGAVLGVAGAAVADGPFPGDRDPATEITATHLPPLLTAPGETVTLRYDVYCPPPGPDPESGAPCDASGTVFVRAGESGAFRPIELRLDPNATEGRYAADLPADLVARTDGLSYYAVLRNRATGATTMLPSGGDAAPMRTHPLGDAVLVRLGAHAFGAARHASSRAAFARWGTGTGEVGLETGPQLQPIGGSSFDVDAAGAVSVLDEANHRVLRFPSSGAPVTTPVDVRGTIADLGVAADGGITVLETVGDGDANPLVRTFDAAGRSRGAWRLAERTAGALRMGPDGPAALGYPSGQWLPVSDHGGALDPAEQRRRGRSGRTLRGGDELVVEREGNEARVAELGRNGAVRKSWRITSDTSLGEIQLAEPFGGGVLVVLRVFTDDSDEFEVLALGPKGLTRRFSVPSRAWAETAPLARFRLQGRSLYELGSTPEGVFVDRFDLEVTS